LILEKASARLPGIKFILKEGTSTQQIDALLSGTLDAALLRPIFDRSQFAVMPVRRERLIAALPRNDPRAASNELSLSDFHQKNFIMYSADGAKYSFNVLTDMFAQERISPVMTYYLDQIDSIHALVSAGLGAALVPDSAAQSRFPNVIFRNVKLDPPKPLEIVLSWRSQNANPALPIFLSLCRELFAGQV
jgi:DNA-binding transcriptional LysR family regulator